MTQSPRLFSVDLFRGLTIAAMLIVNNPGNWSHVYPPLLHATWIGCTPTDLIFPFFLFIVGVVLPIALDRRIQRGDTRQKLISKILSRSGIIIGLGLFLAAFPDFNLRPAYAHLSWLHYLLLTVALVGLLWKEIGESFSKRSEWGRSLGLYSKWVAWFAILGMVVFGSVAYDLSDLRWPGVLQRIGLVYGLTASIYLFTTWRIQAIMAVLLLLFYWVWMCHIPMPDGSIHILEPGHNWAAWMDSKILAGHMWSQTKTWDPEGAFSTIPAIATCLLGVLLGKWLQSGEEPQKQLSYIFVSGLALILLGLIWSLDFPLIKALWTSSYVLYTAGWACLFFGLLYWVSDIKGWRRWANPWIAFGTNALIAYLLSGMLAKLSYRNGWPDVQGEWMSLTTHVYQGFLAVLPTQASASLATALLHLLVVWIPVALLYRYRVFIKV